MDNNLTTNIVNTIINIAEGTKVNPKYLVTLAMIESNFNPKAKNPSGAAGLYQFVPSTAKRYNLTNPFDPIAATKAVIHLTIDNINYLLSKDIPVTGANLYLAHQQGPGGAYLILKAAQAGKEVSSVIRRNLNANGGRGLTPQQFVKKWKEKYSSAEENIEKYF